MPRRRTSPPKTSAESAQPEQVNTRGSATRQNIIDSLAFARDSHEDPRDSLSVEALYSAVHSGLWGHAMIAEAKRQGYTTSNTGELLNLGKRPYFERCLRDLIADGEVIQLPDGFVQLAEITNPDAYVPGSGKRAFRRANLSEQAGSLMQADGSGLNDLFPPLGAHLFEELVLSMKVEGFDPTKPIIRDRATGAIIDGKERQRAAVQADVTPIYQDIAFSDDLERVRFALRANWLRRSLMSREDREVLERKLRERHLTTREVASMLGKLVAGEGKGVSVLSRQRYTGKRPSRMKRPMFKQASRRMWTTVDRWMAACRDIREMLSGGTPQPQVCEIINERYGVNLRPDNGTMWSLARNAERWENEGFEFPPYGQIPPLPSDLPGADDELE